MAEPLPPLPEGYTLDQKLPPLPPGYTLDSEVADPTLQDSFKSFKTKAENTWNAIRNTSVGGLGVGLGEIALQGVTGLASSIVGGISGLNELSSVRRDPADTFGAREDYESGRPAFKGEPDPIGAIDYAQEAGTYQPRTEVGQSIDEGLSAAFEKYETLAYEGSSAAGDPIKHVAGATAAYTALMMLPALIGFRRRGKSIAKKEGKAPSTETLRQEATSLYKRADEAKAAVTSKSYDSVLGAIERKLADEGFDLGLHPKTASALKNLQSKAGINQTLKGAEINRKVINGARGAIEKSDARMAGIMMDVYDNWMASLGKKDMLIGDATAVGLYAEARQLWSRKMKSDEIEWAIERAGIRAGQFTGSGFQNALVTEFRQIAMNKNRMRRFSPDEQVVIKAVANGDKITNALRHLGRFAVRGPVSAIPAGIAAGVFGPVGGLAALTVGEVGRRGATARTIKLADKAANAMRQGEP